jgi:hypothetical protein
MEVEWRGIVGKKALSSAGSIPGFCFMDDLLVGTV